MTGGKTTTSCSADGGSAPAGSPTATCASAEPKIPTECAYLKNASTVESSKANFDRIRKPAKLSAPKEIKYKFPGDEAEQDALEYEIEVDGKKKQMIMPKNPPASKSLPTAQQLADSLGAVPPGQFDKIPKIVASPRPNPSDEYWAKEYNKPGFTSAATGGPSGVTFYPSNNWSQEFTDSTMIHEGGHTYSQDLWKNDDTKKAWQKAIDEDKRTPSDYAKSSIGEDFSESLVMYSLSKGTSCEATAKQLYPSRYKVLDGLMGAK